MLRSTLFHIARRHVRWLLCFALLLPVAQWASVAHAFTHATDAGSRSGPEPAAHLQHCPVCPAATAIAAGGLASGAAGLIDALHVCAAVFAPAAATVVPAPARRPANRGPPLLA